MNARLKANLLRGGLSWLSIQRVSGSVPRVLTNEERMQHFRARQPVQFGNAVFRFPRVMTEAEGEAYARAEMMDGRYSTMEGV